MLDSKHFEVVAGTELVESMRQENKSATSVDGNPFTLNGSNLCRLQEQRAQRGILGAEIVRSNYGYSVRYDSGLQDWALLASAKRKQVDGSKEDAIRWVKDWVAHDPTRRYAWIRK